jgi:hypothetical protein
MEMHLSRRRHNKGVRLHLPSDEAMRLLWIITFWQKFKHGGCHAFSMKKSVAEGFEVKLKAEERPNIVCFPLNLEVHSRSRI